MCSCWLEECMLSLWTDFGWSLQDFIFLSWTILDPWGGTIGFIWFHHVSSMPGGAGEAKTAATTTGTEGPPQLMFPQFSRPLWNSTWSVCACSTKSFPVKSKSVLKILLQRMTAGDFLRVRALAYHACICLPCQLAPIIRSFRQAFARQCGHEGREGGKVQGCTSRSQLVTGCRWLYMCIYDIVWLCIQY